MKKRLLSLLFLIVISFFSLFSVTLANEVKTELLDAKVVAVKSVGKESFMDSLVRYQELELEITRGDEKGSKIVVKNSENVGGMVGLQYQEYEEGDKLRVVVSINPDGGVSYSVDGKSRSGSLLALFLLFISVVLVVGKKWGLFSLLALALSFLVIFKLILPLMMMGVNPVFASIIGSTVIIPLTFYISHGVNRKTHVGVVATFIALLITGFLAVYFVDTTHLTGLASEEAGFLQVEQMGKINAKGLLLAGIIIGTLGILDDVTIGQASAVKQLKEVDNNMGFVQLFTRGMKIGQDHISSMVNTLVLVYSGSALPLLLLFYGSTRSFIDIIEMELIAEEVVRMLVGSIGLVLAAPLATVISAYVFSRDS